MTTPTPRRVDKAGLLIALVLLVLAGIIWRDMNSLQLSSVYGLGPKAMPIVVAVGLAILAVGNAIAAFRGDLPERESLRWTPILLIVAGLALLIAFIRFEVGFIPATSVLFACTAAAFGRRAFVTDLLIGLAAGLVIYLLFAKLLTLTLPMGPLERLIGA
ncbi:tripartite tricarboxylate transporter TctB family protein [Microvirga thermotolerans]|uniref:Tripartite tricarboxylate transporter TctB family protein n=1 Tax=Microvirga thermotolerans TaxID=2651334 RepID=A0A5P9K066_9HYPH|nr:tripartite tricarboxylate transporter TctB family protein [Microvirga thermotolerans]QFU17030.1 tripartite tricarboxylate transporter TctB family protein [Microvirga thermotolerans]